MTRLRMIKVVAAFLVLPLSTQAATVVCSGTVEDLLYHQPGYVLLRLSGMNTYVQICSLNGDWVVAGSMSGTTPAASCKAMYAYFLAAKLSGMSIADLYLDGNTVPASCTSFTAFHHVNVRSFR